MTPNPRQYLVRKPETLSGFLYGQLGVRTIRRLTDPEIPHAVKRTLSKLVDTEALDQIRRFVATNLPWSVTGLRFTPAPPRTWIHCTEPPSVSDNPRR